MNPLPVVRDACVPRCGQCCTSDVPFQVAEAREAVRYLVAERGAAASDLVNRWEAERPASCPFLDDEARCLVYDRRPSVCRAFGHLEGLPCPREVDGETSFTRFTPADGRRWYRRMRPRRRDTPVIRSGDLGDAIRSAAKGDLRLPAAVPLGALQRALGQRVL